MKVNGLYETKILRLNNEGEGIGSIEGITTFIPYALKDETVKVKIDKIYDNYATGNIVEIIDKSNDRIDPICPYFYTCGGCNLMHLNYDKQLEKIKSDTLALTDDVINKQMKVVQEIASLLGETTAETKAAIYNLKKTFKGDE